jgi:hypothetical protein
VDNADSLRDKAVAKLLASEAPPTVDVPEPSPAAVAAVDPTDQQNTKGSYVPPTIESECSHQDGEKAVDPNTELPLTPTAPPVELTIGTKLPAPLPAEMNSRASAGFQVYGLQEE